MDIQTGSAKVNASFLLAFKPRNTAIHTNSDGGLRFETDRYMDWNNSEPGNDNPCPSMTIVLCALPLDGDFPSGQQTSKQPTVLVHK